MRSEPVPASTSISIHPGWASDLPLSVDSLLADVADHEGHGEVLQTVAPGDFHDGVERDEVVACVEHTDIAFAAANVNELEARQ